MGQGRSKAIQSRVFVGLMICVALGCVGQSGSRDVPPPQVTWLKETAKPFATTDPTAKDDDLAVLAPMVARATLVGLGEATHGTSEFFRMKHRIFRYLVERQGFTAFGLEADLAACQALDRFILTGEGNPRELVASLGMWPWATGEVVDMLTWMRDYNADPAHHGKVRFFGFDMQDGDAPLQSLLAYLNSIDPKDHKVVGEALLPLARVLGAGNPGRLFYLAAPAALRDACRETILETKRWMESHRERYVAAKGLSAFEWAVRMVELLDQHETYLRAEEWRTTLMPVNLRDRSMADNVDWAIRYFGPGTKAVLWAHNGHVNKKGRLSPLWVNTGDWLNQRHGASYLSVGFAFGAGGFNAQPSDHEAQAGNLRPFQVPPLGVGSYEDAFLQAGLPLAFLDLRNLDLTQPGARWFAQPRPFREVGTSYSPQDPGEGPTDLISRFDILIFMRQVTPTRLLGRGLPGPQN